MTSSGSALWYLSRATGVMSLVLLTLVLLGGILVRSGAAVPRLPRFVLLGLHRNVALLSVVFLAVHIATAVIDPYASIKWVDAVVPFASSYRPLWLGLGAAAFDLILAVIVTSLLRVRIGVRTWRVVHWSTYAAWPIALVHGLGTGTDVGRLWLQSITVVCVATVVAALLWRLGKVEAFQAGPRVAAGMAVVGAPLVLTVWTLAGPLAPHWAARAGTPPAILSAGSAATSASSAGPKQSNTGKPSGTATLTGTVSERDEVDQATVTLSGALAASGSGSSAGRLTLVLRGQPAAGGGVALSSGTAAVRTAGGGNWTGAITGLHGDLITARLHAGTEVVSLSAQVQIGSDGSLTGTVTFR